MITNKDLEIENISYTNKDFGQIYPELVELAGKLTNKWDPTSTNESDPGIVLLKLVAFIGDKLNYNIDKNALEQFITSATQESSMRELTEMLGYNMHYYRSAVSTVTFRYLGTMGSSETVESDPLASAETITLKAFDTTFKTDDDVIYTLLSDLTVYSDQKYTPMGAKCIQGQLSELSITGSESNLIQLYNLDENNRVYFPEVDVAENGIFINKDSGVYDEVYNTDVWHRVDSLNDQELGQKIFKFGFDSKKGYPYIQFPKDIAYLVGDGLSISYVISNGTLGKVTSGKLTTINTSKIVYTLSDGTSNSYTDTLDDDKYLINNSSSSEAKDPETIDEAYNNFKTTIGTFDTLVSCRDYSNYLRSYIDDLNTRLVSNVQVTDVRTDPSYSKEIITRDSYGNTFYTHSLVNTTKYNSLDLILHGTTPINTSITNINTYNATYSPLSDNDLSTINSNSALDDIKTIIHQFKLPETDSIDFIEARYKLSCNIILKSNISTAEQIEVLQNIRQALYTNYNAIKVDFGEEIPYDNLVQVIKNSDTHIKTVSLDDPDLEYYARLQNTTSKYINLSEIDEESKETIAACIADNILAGRLPLYVEDTSFKYDYNIDLSTSTSLSKYSNVAGFYANLDIPAVTQDNPYTLKKHESIQIIEDSYLTQISYPAYIYYSFTSGTAQTAGSLVIKKNQIYKLGQNEKLYIQYTDSSDIDRYIIYKEGDIIKPSFDIVNLEGIAKIENTSVEIENKVASKFVNWAEKKVNKDLNYSKYTKTPSEYPNITPLFAIGTNEQIDILKLNNVELPVNSKCFWYIKPKIINTSSNTPSVITQEYTDNNNIVFKEIDSSSTYPTGYRYMYVLEEGEYLIYPTEDMLSLNVLGSGTKILSKEEKIVRSNREIINLTLLENSILDQDVGTFEKAYTWETLSSPIIVVETEISTFIEGATLTQCPELDSSWKQIDSDSIAFTDTDLSLSNYANPLVRTLLSITCANDNSQEVLDNQTIFMYTCDDSSISETSKFTKHTINKNSVMQISPEVDIYNNVGCLGELKYTQVGSSLYPEISDSGIYLYNFSYSTINYVYKTASTTDITKLSNFIAAVKDRSSVIFNSRSEYVIPKDTVKSVLGNNKKLICDIDSSYGLKISTFNTYQRKTDLLDCSIGKVIDLTTFLDYATSENNLYISIPRKLSVYSYLADIIDDVMPIISDYSEFDPLADLNTYKMISSYSPLYSYLDVNNIYNKLTLSKIDFNNSVFNIVGGTRKW